jgi:hypothetical protein
MSVSNENNILSNSALKAIKIKFNKIILLEEEDKKNYEGTYYISLILNNIQPQNSKFFDFSKNSECILNQTMSLDNGELKKKYIKIELYQKEKIYSNLVLKGEIFNENYLYDNSSKDFICYLHNNEGVEKAVIYYIINFTSSNNNDTNDAYNENVKRIEKVIRRSLTNENNINNLFLINLEYIKLISNEINAVLNWKDKWKTLSYLFSFTFIILFFKIFYVFVFPLYLIYIHINNKNNIEKFIITKDSVDNSNNKKINKMIFYRIMFLYNKMINIYENIMFKIINGRQLRIELYKRIGIAMISNIFFFNFKLYNLINFKIIIISILWFHVLRRNPSFYSFSLFIYNIIEERTLFITSNQQYFYYKTNLINLIIVLNPFYSLYRLYQEETIDYNSFVFLSQEKKDKNLVKYELYENERFWMFVGWNKDLIFNESPAWYKVDKPKEFCDKNMVRLPGGDNGFKWISEWKIEKNNNSDENGWEYSNNFNSNFGTKKGKQNVRRRKWIRYAIKN